MAKNILGSMIQALRKEKGITQEELGKAIGVTAQAVSNWECGGMPDAGFTIFIALSELVFTAGTNCIAQEGEKYGTI